MGNLNLKIIWLALLPLNALKSLTVAAWDPPLNLLLKTLPGVLLLGLGEILRRLFPSLEKPTPSALPPPSKLTLRPGNNLPAKCLVSNNGFLSPPPKKWKHLISLKVTMLLTGLNHGDLMCTPWRTS